VIRFIECATFIETVCLNVNALDSLMKIYRFYQRSIAKAEQANEGTMLSDIFKEFRDGTNHKLTSEDLEIMKQEVPMEILIK
jgi:hypothetical protein